MRFHAIAGGELQARPYRVERAKMNELTAGKCLSGIAGPKYGAKLDPKWAGGIEDGVFLALLLLLVSVVLAMIAPLATAIAARAVQHQTGLWGSGVTIERARPGLVESFHRARAEPVNCADVIDPLPNLGASTRDAFRFECTPSTLARDVR